MMRPDGPIPAQIMLVGEFPGDREESTGVPFSGTSGQELNRMLHEAGIMRSECLATNVLSHQPPHGDSSAYIAVKKNQITPVHIGLKDKLVLPALNHDYQRLLGEINATQPNVIVALGNLSLWALTGKWGITKWRGSVLQADAFPVGETPPIVIPTFNPAAITRQWENRAICVRDLRRAAEYRQTRVRPDLGWKFTTRPSFQQVMDRLLWLRDRLDQSELWLEFDLETRAGHIACAGISWSRTEALSIPFMCVENKDGYWGLEEEAIIVWHLSRVLQHRNVKVRWQNGLYDAQYTWRHWHFVPRGAQDTMISQHTAFVGQPKSLAFQASMYSPVYIYWKDEGKDWDKRMGEDELWNYNCVDCVRTREVGEVELDIIEKFGLQEVEAFQQRLFWPVLEAMKRGVAIDNKVRGQMAGELMEEISKREQWFIDVLGHPLNPGSNPQMTKLFYEDLQQPAIWSRPKKGVPSHLTCDDEALNKIKSREPLLAPLCNTIADIRTMNVFMSTFIMAKLDRDGRMRTSFNIAGNTEGRSAPATYRLSSSKDAFESGANLQNIPSDKSKSMGKMAARGMSFNMPNIRRIYVPDPGYTFFDMDLDRADLQVVVWESDDPEMKAALRLGVDMHLLNAYILAKKEPPPLEELIESHPKYPDHRGPLKHKREFSKVFIHGTNYGGGARTMAVNCGISVWEAEQGQKLWFGRRPGIKKWQDRVNEQITKRRYVENKFGYRWHIFGRPDLPEALAWIPQSTVGCVINRAWVNIYENLPDVWVLLQVHDSLAGQFPTHLRDQLIPKIKEQAKIVVPYDDPLVIPVGIKTSEVSWGACA